MRMDVVTVSPKYQIVIPKKVREALKLEPGQELQVYVVDGVIRLTRPRSIKELRGMAKGMKWKDEDRDHTERF
jgi:AbrB family looped-hinge helix DNA binding protein